MGANRPGTRRKQKEKRFKKELERLIKKAEKEAAPSQQATPTSK